MEECTSMPHMFILKKTSSLDEIRCCSICVVAPACPTLPSLITAISELERGTCSSEEFGVLHSNVILFIGTSQWRSIYSVHVFIETAYLG